MAFYVYATKKNYNWQQKNLLTWFFSFFFTNNICNLNIALT